jgi:hypothetical protein
MKLWSKNFAFDMGIVGKVPYLKEIISQFQGYSSSRADTQWIQSLVWAVNSWKNVLLKGKTEKTPTAIKHTLRSFSTFVGLPIYNLYRDVTSIADMLTPEDLEEMFKDFFE